VRQEGPFDWRENYLTGEDMMPAGSPSPVYDSRSLAEIRSAAEDATNAKRPDAPNLWKAFHEKRREMEQTRALLREINAAAAAELGERVGKIAGVIVEYAEADDFGMIELRITVDGKRFWTRLVQNPAKGYKALRDAVAAHRRNDYERERNWLSSTEVGRRVVRWYGIDQVVFGENEYGTQRWRR
jgi:hypothetical protein